MFGKKAKKIDELKRTLEGLKEVINSLEEENQDYKTRLFEMELKKKRAGRPKKSTKL